MGDTTYDGGSEGALRLRKRGLFLCSSEIALEHPHYNTPAGQKEWVELKRNKQQLSFLQENEEGRVIIRARIDLPDKFESFLFHENDRAMRFSELDIMT